MPSDCKNMWTSCPFFHMGFDALLKRKQEGVLILGKSFYGPEEKRTDVYEPIFFVKYVAFLPFYG